MGARAGPAAAHAARRDAAICAERPLGACILLAAHYWFSTALNPSQGRHLQAPSTLGLAAGAPAPSHRANGHWQCCTSASSRPAPWRGKPATSTGSPRPSGLYACNQTSPQTPRHRLEAAPRARHAPALGEGCPLAAPPQPQPLAGGVGHLRPPSLQGIPPACCWVCRCASACAAVQRPTFAAPTHHPFQQGSQPWAQPGGSESSDAGGRKTVRRASAGSGKKGRRSGRAPSVCQVEGCGVNLDSGKPFYRLQRICGAFARVGVTCGCWAGLLAISCAARAVAPSPAMLVLCVLCQPPAATTAAAASNCRLAASKCTQCSRQRVAWQCHCPSPRHSFPSCPHPAAAGPLQSGTRGRR